MVCFPRGTSCSRGVFRSVKAAARGHAQSNLGNPILKSARPAGRICVVRPFKGRPGTSSCCQNFPALVVSTIHLAVDRYSSVERNIVLWSPRPQNLSLNRDKARFNPTHVLETCYPKIRFNIIRKLSLS
jgi:hypothetical protein